jgi:cysteine synthase
MCIGIGQGRVTNNLGTFVDRLDGALHIADAKSIAMVYDLLDSEGLYVGASSALNVVAAYELAQQLGPGMSRANHPPNLSTLLGI